MQKETLLERARSLVEKKSSLIAALAVTPLAAASAAHAGEITFTGSSVDTTPAGGAVGGPLATFGGTNGTSAVKLEGSAGYTGTDGTVTMTSFENTGTVDLDPGESVLVEYDFDQVFQTSSGGSADIEFELTLFIDEDGANVSAGDSGMDSFGSTPSGSVTLDRNGSFQTAPFVTGVTGEDLRFVLTGTFETDPGGGFWLATSIDVPMSSITFTTVPEPATGILFGLAIAWVAGVHRFRRWRTRRG